MPSNIGPTGPISLRDIAYGIGDDVNDGNGPYKLRNYYRTVDRRETYFNGVLGMSETGRGQWPNGGQTVKSIYRLGRTGVNSAWPGRENSVGAVYIQSNDGPSPQYRRLPQIWLWHGSNPSIAERISWTTYGKAGGTYLPAEEYDQTPGPFWDAVSPAYQYEKRQPYNTSINNAHLWAQPYATCNNPTQTGYFLNGSTTQTDGSTTDRQWYTLSTRIDTGSSTVYYNSNITANTSSPLKMSTFRGA